MSGFLLGTGSPTASAIKRGKVVRERLFCQPVPEPPTEVPPLSEQSTTMFPTLRSRLEQHRSNPACAGCHSVIDPIGFALENYDHEGLYRTLDNKVPVDSKGVLTGTDVDGAMAGADSLIERLTTSRMVKDCAVTQWFRYFVGRREDPLDLPVLKRLQDTFAERDGNLRELLVDLLTSEPFRTLRSRTIPR
jgi:hypothetical protein